MSASAAGWNPMRWDCAARGCYNVFARPKIERFAEYLPGNRGMMDIDATVDVKGNFLFIEWKHPNAPPMKDGQRIYYENLTGLSERIVAIEVIGDARTMEVKKLRVVHNGVFGAWEETDFPGLCARIDNWGEKMDRAPRHVQKAAAL